MFRLPPPVERPNPYATFVRTFLQARDAQRQYKEDEDRLQLAKEEEKARREAEKVAKEQWKEQQDLRNAEFEFQKLDSERKFKQSELAHKWERARSFRDMRNPTPGKPFSLQLPMGVDEAPMDVNPVTWDDERAAVTGDREKAFQNQLFLHNTPEPAPLPITLPKNLDLSSMGGQSVDPRVLGAAVSRANNADSIAAMNSRADRGSPLDRVTIKDGLGNVTGILDRKAALNGEPNAFVPVSTPGMRTTAIPTGEFNKMDEGVPALMGIAGIKAKIVDFQKISSLAHPVDKAKSAIDLNAALSSLAPTVGRFLGERGAFTENDRATYKAFFSPGTVYSTLAPEEQMKRVNWAEEMITKLAKYRANTFFQRYGIIPEDKKHLIDQQAIAADPGGLR